MILFMVIFETQDGIKLRLDTTEPAKIGLWLAEMFGLFPWSPAYGHQPVSITTSTLRSS